MQFVSIFQTVSNIKYESVCEKWHFMAPYKTIGIRSLWDKTSSVSFHLIWLANQEELWSRYVTAYKLKQ